MLKLCNRCGKATANRPAVCDECRLKEPETRREQNRYYDTKLRDPRAKAFYNSAPWQKLRAAYLASINYLCEDCVAEVSRGERKLDEVRIATDVHHVVPIAENWGLRLVWGNLRGLCGRHHKAQHGETT